MSKLDWSKAGSRDLDPARVQRVNDFVEPDRVIVRVSEITAEDRELLGQLRSKHAKEKAKLKALLKRKPKRKVKAVPQQPKLTPEEQALAAEARRVANLAKAQSRLAEAEAKKKSHLEAWAEEQKALSGDRKVLRQTWREKLFGQRKGIEP